MVVRTHHQDMKLNNLSPRGASAPKGDNMNIRTIIGKDGEEYINAKDLGIVLQKLVFKMPVPAIGVMNFVRRFIIEYITARR